MMRLLFLCLLLLLPAATGESEHNEASGNGEIDDEDLNEEQVNRVFSGNQEHDLEKTTGTDESSDQMTMIVIIVAVAALTLSIGAIITIMLVRRHMQHRQQGIYTVPIEQHQKGV